MKLTRRVFRTCSKARLCAKGPPNESEAPITTVETFQPRQEVASSAPVQGEVEQVQAAVDAEVKVNLQDVTDSEHKDDTVLSEEQSESEDSKPTQVVAKTSATPTASGGSILEKRLKWLETERVRLLQLSRFGSSRSSPFKKKRKSIEGKPSFTRYETALKEFSVSLDLSQFTSHEEEKCEDVKENLFILATGLKVLVENNSLVVKEFVVDETGNAGQLELSGHVGVEDILISIHGEKVGSLEELDEAILRCAGSSEVRLEFGRKYSIPVEVNGNMSTEQLLAHIKGLEEELSHARSEYARLDIGALESLEDALNDSRSQLAALEIELERIRIERSESDEHYIFMKKRLEEKERECRNLYNNLVDLKGAIRVFVRVRPSDEPETTETKEEAIENSEGSREDNESILAKTVLRFPEERCISVTDFESTEVPEKTWDFDAVFPPSASQSSVYQEVEPLVFSAVNGFNACVFAYGQTGSGKTYTMDGPESDRGVYYRATETLFDAIEKRKNLAALKEQNIDFQIKASVVEIYQERVRDLLNPYLGQSLEASRKGDEETVKHLKAHIPYSLDICHDPQTNYVFVKGVQEVVAKSAKELHEIIERGKQYRVVGVTNMNQRSSRSHLVLLISITSTLTYNDGNAQPYVVRSKLQLIDLAGSERARHVPAGNRMKETGAINKSLSALGDVMHALQNDDTRHVPFRNSKLTSLLRDSLGGKAKTLVMVQVSPSRTQIHETVRTLDFAQRVGKICFGSSARRLDGSEQLARLKKENLDLSGDLHKYRLVVKDLRDTIDAEKKEKKQIIANLRAVQGTLELEKKSWANKAIEYEEEITLVKRDRREVIRKEKDSSKTKQDSELKRLQNESNVAHQEMKHLRTRNTDLKRENKEMFDRIKSLEKQLGITEKPTQPKKSTQFSRYQNQSSENIPSGNRNSVQGKNMTAKLDLNTNAQSILSPSQKVHVNRVASYM